MKSLFLSCAVLSLIVANTTFASAQAEEGTDQGSCQVAPAPTDDQISQGERGGELDASNQSAANVGQFGFWHCTAYPDGHGHAHGFNYRNVLYFSAYTGAVYACERATSHHCHDVHCHFDNH